MQRFGLSERQASAILEMRLRRLTGMERDEIVAELEAVRAEIARLRAILDDEGLLLDLIEQEMVAVRDQYGDERRTNFVAASSDFDLEDLIPVEDMVVTVSHAGYVKRVSLSEYRTQHRGGRGKSGMTTKIKTLWSTSSSLRRTVRCYSSRTEGASSVEKYFICLKAAGSLGASRLSMYCPSKRMRSWPWFSPSMSLPRAITCSSRRHSVG